MKCLAYRSTRHPEMYLFIDRAPADADLPEALREHMGRLELTPERRLARTDGATVIANIEQQGFHLQVPPARE